MVRSVHKIASYPSGMMFSYHYGYNIQQLFGLRSAEYCRVYLVKKFNIIIKSAQ